MLLYVFYDLFFIFHLSESPPEWVAPNPGGCPVTAYAITQATSATSANVQVLHKKLEGLVLKTYSVDVKEITSYPRIDCEWILIGSGMAILLSYDTRDSYRSIPSPSFSFGVVRSAGWSGCINPDSARAQPLDSVENGGSWWLAVWCFRDSFLNFPYKIIHSYPFL